MSIRPYLRELGKFRVGEQRRVSEQLVTDVTGRIKDQRSSSLKIKDQDQVLKIKDQISSSKDQRSTTHGSGVYLGSEWWRMYWVEWKTRKARPDRILSSFCTLSSTL